jgi:multiple sugar transport system permease protein
MTRVSDRGGKGGAKLGEAVAGYTFLAPFLVVLVLFALWPLARAFWLSFHSYDLFSPPRFVGLDNYRYLFGELDFWISIRNTALYTFVVVFAQTSLAILLALVMDQKLRGKTFFRTAFFLPSVTSSVAISLIFMFLFFKNGVLNQFLAATRLDVPLGWLGLEPPIDWLGDTRTALWAIMAQNVWSTAGFFMIIVLAGLQEIPDSLYEAARVDGASGLQQFWYITLPSLRPTIFYVVTMGFIGCFQVFDQVYVMTEGGPLKSTLTTAYLLYKEAFVNFNMGYACAIAFVLAGIIFATTMIQKRLMGE